MLPLIPRFQHDSQPLDSRHLSPLFFTPKALSFTPKAFFHRPMPLFSLISSHFSARPFLTIDTVATHNRERPYSAIHKS